jgi:hypothetical protein
MIGPQFSSVAQHLPTAVPSMTKLEHITRGSSVRGILPEELATVLNVKWLGNVAIEVTYKEINYWDHRAAQLEDQEPAGRVNAKLNSGLARLRADELAGRLQKRTAELEQDRKLSALPPVLLGGALIIPFGLIRKLQDARAAAPPTFARETERSERLAIQAVLDAERKLGYDPRDVSTENSGYDIESRIPGTGRLRFIEVKGRVRGAGSVTLTSS